MFLTMDRDGNGSVTYAEVQDVPLADWEVVSEHVKRLEGMLIALEDRWHEMHEEGEGGKPFVNDEL